MRLIRLLIALACIFAGGVLGALNRTPVSIDLAFGQVAPPLGMALILTLLLGVLLGGLAITASVVLPLRSRLSRLQRQPPAPAATTGPEQSDGTH